MQTTLCGERGRGVRRGGQGGAGEVGAGGSGGREGASVVAGGAAIGAPEPLVIVCRRSDGNA